MRFQVLFTYDSEYGGYMADVPELPGCMSQGKTVEVAAENIRDAIKAFLVVLANHGTPYVESVEPRFVAEIVL
jgi:predicted RNase H-like HicB family nuclease